MAGQYQHRCRPSGQLVPSPVARKALAAAGARDQHVQRFPERMFRFRQYDDHPRIAYDSPGLGTLADGEHANENAQPGYSGSR